MTAAALLALAAACGGKTTAKEDSTSKSGSSDAGSSSPPPSREGESCSVDWWCAVGLRCNDVTHECERDAINGNCHINDDCNSAYYCSCDAAKLPSPKRSGCKHGVCIPRRIAGQGCANDGAAGGANANDCTPPNHCAPDRHVCVAPGARGALCEVATDCASKSCVCSGACTCS